MICTCEIPVRETKSGRRDRGAYENSDEVIGEKQPSCKLLLPISVVHEAIIASKTSAPSNSDPVVLPREIHNYTREKKYSKKSDIKKHATI